MTIDEYFVSLRKSRKLSQGELCKGLCSVAQYCRFERGQIILDKIIIDRLLERLGKNPSGLEFIGNDAEYQFELLQEKINSSIINEDFSEADNLLCKYEKLPLNKDINLHIQYICEKRAEINYIENNVSQTELYAFKALKCTKINIDKSSYVVLSILEFNALFFLSAIRMDGFEIMKKLNKYINDRSCKNENISKFSVKIKYYMAQYYHEHARDNLALAYLDSAKDFLRQEFITEDLFKVLQLSRQIQGDKFNEDDILTAAWLLSNYYQNDGFTEEILKKWESMLSQK